MGIRIVAVSDTHTQHHKLDLPEGDILIHSGDFTNIGRIFEVGSFIKWLESLGDRYRDVVFIAGNHDKSLDKDNPNFVPGLVETFSLSSNIHYLMNSGVVVQGIKIWGSPYTPRYGYGWAFQLNHQHAAEFWAQMPHADVIVTHGPPQGIGDRTMEGIDAGCPALRARIAEIKPLVHIFGHIHEAHGLTVLDGTHYHNVSSLDRDYKVANKPVVIDLE
jgi:Icc-related predicted phosphoesterase